MNFSSHGNGHGLNDLYITYESDRERELVVNFIKEKNIKSWQYSFDEIERKTMIEIPFGESYQEDIKKYINQNA